MSKPESVWAAVHGLIRQLFDRDAVGSARLAAIEDRLAVLDGGDKSDAALRAALVAANATRIDQGEEAIRLTLKKRDGKTYLTGTA